MSHHSILPPQPNNVADRHKAAEILTQLTQMCTEFGNDFIVIGGWAVYAYKAKTFSLDGDAMISAATSGTLRDQYLVSKNPRMRKEQISMTEQGYDIDLYVEHQHGLPVAFDELQAHAKHIDGLNVACPEHLLVLKMAAWHDRRATPKGKKDEEDIVFMLERVIDSKGEISILARYLDEADWQSISTMSQSIEITERVCNNNAWVAKTLRTELKQKITQLKNECDAYITQPSGQPQIDG